MHTRVLAGAPKRCRAECTNPATADAVWRACSSRPVACLPAAPGRSLCVVCNWIVKPVPDAFIFCPNPAAIIDEPWHSHGLVCVGGVSCALRLPGFMLPQQTDARTAPCSAVRPLATRGSQCSSGPPNAPQASFRSHKHRSARSTGTRAQSLTGRAAATGAFERSEHVFLATKRCTPRGMRRHTISWRARATSPGAPDACPSTSRRNISAPCRGAKSPATGQSDRFRTLGPTSVKTFQRTSAPACVPKRVLPGAASPALRLGVAATLWLEESGGHLPRTPTA